MTPEGVDDAIRKVLEGFDKGVFVRNIERDADPAWAVKLLAYLGALAVLRRHVDRPVSSGDEQA